MNGLRYSTGYAADYYQADEFLTLSKIIQMEILLFREQRVNDYQISPMTISELRSVGVGETMAFFVDYCRDIMSFLKIGELFDEGQSAKHDLLLRYTDPEDAKLLERIFQEVENDTYGDELYFFISLEEHPDATDEEVSFLEERFIYVVDHMASLMECGLKRRSFEFSDGSLLCPIAYSYWNEIDAVLSTFLEGAEDAYDILIRKKGIPK